MKSTLFFVLAVGWWSLAITARAETIEVPEDFSTIQDAVDAAADGDVISVAPGIYVENIQLRADIELRGEETARTILRPNSAGAIMQVPNISNVVIKNFTFTDSEVGISVDGSNIDINNNVFDIGNSGTGIQILTLGSTASIINNTFFDNETAIGGTADESTIQNNIFASNATSLAAGIDEDDVSFNCFSENPVGADSTEGDPDFVDAGERDFHLRVDSPCIDAGTGTDKIDDGSEADAGAYGGEFTDPRPFPIPQPDAVASATNSPSVFDIEVNWPANLDYRVDGYRLYYDSDQSDPPYEGTDAEDASGQPAPSPIDVGNVTSYTLHNLDAVAAIPEAPVLEAASPSNQNVALRWSAVPGASGYRIHYGLASLDENSVDAGNVTSFEINGLENGNVYRITVTALNQPTYYLAITAIDNDAPEPDESVLSEERAVSLGEEQESIPSNELTAIPEVVEPFPNLPDQGDSRCFIATAAYGHYSNPHVQVLRDFRDTYLMNHPSGRAFVQWYYARSPSAATLISEHPLLKTLTAWALLPVVGTAYLMLHMVLILKIAFAACCLALLTWIGLRKTAHG